MRFRRARALASAVLILLSLAGDAPGDAVIPGNILDPKTAAEAWNVIRLATGNIERLIEEDRLAEIPVQASYCSPSLRTLARLVTTEDAIARVEPMTARAISWLGAIARTAQQDNPAGTREAFTTVRTLLAELQKDFDPKAVASEIYYCPVHPDFLSESPKTPCAKCGTRLLIRRIPYSFIYMKPGPPTIRMTATASAPVVAGRQIEVKLRLEKADQSPVTYDDLMLTHAEPIHLLIEDPSLGDYHHERPKRTETPGEYAFSFIPAKTGSYRIWADLLPAATGVPELPFVDLPSEGTGGRISDTGTRYTSSAGGYQFTLTMAQGNHIPVQSRRARGMTISVADAEGRPVTQLEPVMTAFAHLVGFHGDYQTVVHLHPTGGEVLDEKARGGPTLGFVLFPPKPGFIRLYCQVRVGGKTLFAQFNVNVEP
ncbi:MAG: hypothetical protein ABMA01_07285 [Chthoniobacteraceae bacterium]